MPDTVITLFSIGSVLFATWLIPGPNHLAIANAATTGGRRDGLLTAWGIATGVALWGVIAVAGVAVVFEVVPGLFAVLRAAGAAYLIWLGISALRAGWRSRGASPQDMTHRASVRPFSTGLLIALTNPKAALFFGSIITAFIPASAGVALMAVIVAEIAVISLVLNTIAALFFSLSAVMGGMQRAGPLIAIVIGVLFLALGMMVAVDLASGQT